MKLALKHFLALLMLLSGGYGFIYANVASKSASRESVKITSGLAQLLSVSSQDGQHIRKANRNAYHADRISFEENQEENCFQGLIKKQTEILHYFSVFYPSTNIYQSSPLRLGLLFRKHFSHYSAKLYIVLRAIRI